MKFIIGKKIGMTQVFDKEGRVVPVTKVAAGPCVVTQVKTLKKDGIDSLQLGFGEQKKFRLNKAKQGHLKDLATVRVLRDFKAGADEQNIVRGSVLTVKNFIPGDLVQVVGTSKGRGFQGVVKRHHFAGGPASHGHKDNLRMPGSIGAGGVQRVFKGMRMGGHMGDARVTVKNLEIVAIDPKTNELMIKGAVPGARNGLLLISTATGKMEVEMNEAPAVVEEKKVEAPVTEAAATTNTATA